MKYITVILPLKLEWEPYYEASGHDLRVGDRVRVNFAFREYSAVVSGVMEEVPDVRSRSLKIKPVICKEESLEPVFPEEIRLWKMVAEYYMCSVGEVYKAAYPAGKISLEEARARAEERKKAMIQKTLAGLRNKEARLKTRLENKLGKKDELLLKIENARSAEKSESLRTKLQVLESEIDVLGNDLDEVLRKINCTAGLRDSERAGNDGPTAERASEQRYKTGIVLSEEQEKAKEDIRKAFSERQTVLLNGVTGSGKTEIYLTLASETLSAGKNVLYLVPEIALSRQLQDRVASVFADCLYTFHSGETMASRRNTAESIRSSRGSQDNCHNARGYIVLGTRSSLFLPHNNLGLIIVDEEHDTSYKQDSPAPRYNGRDVAVMLASIHGCNILLGSATPSLESLYNCIYGKFHLTGLEKRYYDSVSAGVEIVNTIAERKKNGMIGSFSKRLIVRMRDTLERGEQVIILRARKSFSPVLQCTGCGYIPKCPNCNVSLSYHKRPERMLCHTCGYSRPFAPECPECGQPLKGIGAGTQKIEEELKSLFPQARIARLDGDLSQNQAYEKEVIRKFAGKETDILVGTQIVTKGFDFPDLTLVAVIQADSMLGVQDFRADERAFQVLEQFRGRCGRRDRKGLFVIQTSQPDHPVYQKLLNGDDNLGKSLLEERSEFGFPPFTRIVNVHLKDNIESRVECLSWSLSADLISAFGQDIVTGPYTPVVDKVAGDFLRVIRLSLKKDKFLINNKKRLAEIVAAFQDKNKYAGHIHLDVDP